MKTASMTRMATRLPSTCCFDSEQSFIAKNTKNRARNVLQ